MIKNPNQVEGTIVGSNVKLQGTLKDSGDILIHGSVEGEVISDKTVVVTESATVKGPITAQVVTIGGTIRGSIDAREKLEILPSGQVSGSISTNQLIIQPGAIFNGKSVMGEKDKKVKEEEADQEKVKTVTDKQPEEKEPRSKAEQSVDLTYELE